MPTYFLDLPLELLPVVLSFVIKSHHLTLLCRVNKSFYEFACPRLYERPSIYSWHREGKVKAIQLFKTLSSYAHLAQQVRRLELRDFPKSAIRDPDILEIVIRGLRNCKNLRACTWTRDGSLRSDILLALQESQYLQELEINGNDEYYDPQLLSRFTNLTKISIIMPSIVVVRQLESWLTVTGNTLRNLTLICKATSVITDDVLKLIAPHLTQLEQLNLTGCPKVTHHGVLAVISSGNGGLVSLGLEGVSPAFDMETFAHQSLNNRALRHLRSMTLTIPKQASLSQWMINVIDLLSLSALQVFHIYSTDASVIMPNTDHFWSQLVLTHGSRLKRLGIHRMPISLDAIMDICLKCTTLEQLFFVLQPHLLDVLPGCLKHAHHLRVLHINFPLKRHSNTLPFLPAPDALKLVSSCSSTLTQFGCNTRVWQIGRIIHVGENGTLTSSPNLLPYESPEIPEAFVVVRT